MYHVGVIGQLTRRQSYNISTAVCGWTLPGLCGYKRHRNCYLLAAGNSHADARCPNVLSLFRYQPREINRRKCVWFCGDHEHKRHHICTSKFQRFVFPLFFFTVSALPCLRLKLWIDFDGIGWMCSWWEAETHRNRTKRLD